MAGNTRRTSKGKRTAAGTRAGGTASRARPAAAPDHDLESQQAAGSGPGAGADDDTPGTAAGLGGATDDGDGLTNAALTAAHLADDDEALARASEPEIVIERLTVQAVPDDAGHPGLLDAAIDREQRWLLIAERAYLRAAERGFAAGHELDDWLAAEREVNARLGGGG
jgi:hypothetical protein